MIIIREDYFRYYNISNHSCWTLKSHLKFKNMNMMAYERNHIILLFLINLRLKTMYHLNGGINDITYLIIKMVRWQWLGKI